MASTQSSFGYEGILEDLERALGFCSSLGLTEEASEGRFLDYRGRLQRLVEVVTRARAGSELSSEEHAHLESETVRYRMAVSEALEFGQLIPFLKTRPQTQVRRRLRKVLAGPSLPSEEDPVSNEARNIQFELFLASQIWKAGFQPELGEHPDVKVHIEEFDFLIECKRLYSVARLGDRIQDAGVQLRHDLESHPQSGRGLVAISLSRVMNPTDEAPLIASADAGRAALEAWLSTVSEHAAPFYWKLIEESVAVGAIFHTASGFSNTATGRFDHGNFFVGEVYVPPGAAYKPALNRLLGGLEQLAH
jgi:hypothetical protein